MERTCENCYYFDDSEAFGKICLGKRFDTIEEDQEHSAKMQTAEYRASDKFCFVEKGEGYAHNLQPGI